MSLLVIDYQHDKERSGFLSLSLLYHHVIVDALTNMKSESGLMLTHRL